MLTKLLSSQKTIYHIILFFSFSLTVNYFVELKIVNFIAYVLFHLTLIYFIFYFFHFTLYFIFFLYGVLFNIYLINNIGPHIISFLIFLTAFQFLKKFLLNFSSFKISFIIFIIVFIMFVIESFISRILYNYPINYNDLGLLFLISVLMFLPSLYMFSKIDKL